MTLWGYQVDLDVYVTPIHIIKKKKKVTVCEEEKITRKIGLSQ